MRSKSVSQLSMTQAAQPSHKGQARLPATLETTAECRLHLPPFASCVNGWAGLLSEFLAHVRDGTFPLEGVPLASVVDQYIRHLGDLDLDSAGERLDLVASLIYWKSRLLLPCNPLRTGLEEDPRQQILRDLREGQQRQNRGKASPANTANQDRSPENTSELSLLDLFVLLNDVEQAVFRDSSYQVPAPSVTVADQLQWLSQWFAGHDSVVGNAHSLFLLHQSHPAKLCLLLALLEMAKRGQLRLDQTAAFGVIIIHPVKAQTPRLSSDQQI